MSLSFKGFTSESTLYQSSQEVLSDGLLVKLMWVFGESGDRISFKLGGILAGLRNKLHSKLDVFVAVLHLKVGLSGELISQLFNVFLLGRTCELSDVSMHLFVLDGGLALLLSLREPVLEENDLRGNNLGASVGVSLDQVCQALHSKGWLVYKRGGGQKMGGLLFAR